eukprot:scaffold13196_cov117-Isochrysis_galbana.AAC.3
MFVSSNLRLAPSKALVHQHFITGRCAAFYVRCRFVRLSINQSLSFMSISSYSSDHSAASQSHSQAFTQSTPSRQSGMVQPVVQEPRDVCDRARRRFVSSRSFQFMYNLRFDNKSWEGLTSSRHRRP